jgi:hypothetical protein
LLRIAAFVLRRAERLGGRFALEQRSLAFQVVRRLGAQLAGRALKSPL